MLTVAGVAAVLGLLLTRALPEPAQRSLEDVSGEDDGHVLVLPIDPSAESQKRRKCQRFLTPSPRSSQPLSPRTVDSDHEETLGVEAVPPPTTPTKGGNSNRTDDGTVVGRAVHDCQTHNAEGSICVRTVSATVVP